MSESNKLIAAIIMWVMIIWGGASSPGAGLLAFVGVGIGLTYLMLMQK